MIDEFFLIFLFVWLLFASFILLHIRSGIRRNNLLNKRVQDLLDQMPECESDIDNLYVLNYENRKGNQKIVVDQITGVYKKE